jgi:hypothetical protein
MKVGSRSGLQLSVVQVRRPPPFPRVHTHARLVSSRRLCVSDAQRARLACVLAEAEDGSHTDVVLVDEPLDVGRLRGEVVGCIIYVHCAPQDVLVAPFSTFDQTLRVDAPESTVMDILECAGEHLSVADVCIALGEGVAPDTCLSPSRALTSFLNPPPPLTDADPTPFIPYVNVLSLSVSSSPSFSEDPDAADLSVRLHLPSIRLVLDADDPVETPSAADKRAQSSLHEDQLGGEQLRRALCEPGCFRFLRRRTAERFLKWRRRLFGATAVGGRPVVGSKGWSSKSSHLSPLLPSIDDPLHLPSLIRLGLGLVTASAPSSPPPLPPLPDWIVKAAAVTVSIVAAFTLGWAVGAEVWRDTAWEDMWRYVTLG